MSDYNKTNIGSGYNTSTSINTELGKIETAVNSKVDKSGSTMTGDLDLNSNDILNANSVDVQQLSINGTNVTASGASVSTLPDQTGNSGKVLTTNGSTASWDGELLDPARNYSATTTTVYVDDALGTDSPTNGTGTGTSAYKTIQYALDQLPTVITHDTIIEIADGVYNDVGGQDEFGRGVCVDVSKKVLAVQRDSSKALNEKLAKLVFRGESEAGTIIDGTNNSTTRYVFWCHETQGIQFENLTCRNSYGGIISHQNADVTLRDVTTTGCDFGRMIESNSRMEVLRGSNTGNTRAYFIKNGQLQENDSNIGSSTENNFLIDGTAWIYLLRVDMTGTASKNQIDTNGAVWMEFDDCDISSGNNLVVGSYSAMRLSNGTRVRDFSSAVWANEAGYTDTDGLCHIHNNNFIAFCTKGQAFFNLDNADSLNASAVDEPNTNGLRLQGSATSALIDPDVSISSGDKILSRPTSGLIFKGTAPPSDVNTYYERGALTLNEAASDFSTPFWVNTVRGFGGAIDFEPYAVYGSTTYDPPSLADGDGVTTTVTCTGADLGDFTSVSFSLDLQGITVTSWVSAANTVSVRFQNESGGVLDLGSGTLRVKAGKF